MAFLDIFRGSRNRPDYLAGPLSTTAISSPWSTSQLQTVVWSDVFGTTPTLINRAEALTLPAVAKARSVLISLIADKPLRALRSEALATDQPTWLYRTDGQVSPWHRMVGTIDDLVFYGWSLWLVDRGASGQITRAIRVPFERWTIDGEGQILIDEKPVDEERIILIPGPSEGLLNYGTRTLRGAISLESAWIARAKNPIPALELHETQESGITPDEAQAVVQQWAKARSDPNGSVAFTPWNLEVKTHGEVDAAMFTEGRNFSKIDVANFFALPAALLDGSLSTATLTYSTQEGKRNEVLDYTLPYWVGGIEGRLSQDDVVPAGNRVRFDFSTLINNPQTPTGAVVED